MIGIAFNIEGAEEGEETAGWRVVFEIAWWSFFFGAIASLLTSHRNLHLHRKALKQPLAETAR